MRKLSVGQYRCVLRVLSGCALLIGPGPFSRILEDATGRKGVVVGKPGSTLTHLIMSQYGLGDPKRVLFVGDM